MIFRSVHMLLSWPEISEVVVYVQHLNAAATLCVCVISLKVLKCFCFSLQSRIKKIMQKDAEVGRIAMAVPVIICIILHLFI